MQVCPFANFSLHQHLSYFLFPLLSLLAIILIGHQLCITPAPSVKTETKNMTQRFLQKYFLPQAKEK